MLLEKNESQLEVEQEKVTHSLCAYVPSIQILAVTHFE